MRMCTMDINFRRGGFTMVSVSADEEIRRAISQYPSRGSALLPTLHITQRELGWLPREAIESVADQLELPRAHVKGVVSFHSMLNSRPAARNIVQLCTNVSCMLFGAETLLDKLKDRFGLEPGGITADGRFSLAVMECLGLCDRAPSMLVNGNVHSGLDTGNIVDILEGYD
jgi:NADH-quinone oxidoreductase subunit E